MRVRAPLIIFGQCLVALLVFVLDCDHAYAQREPVIVVPGRAGYQVLLWGQDISGAVVEGEFGLDRPGVVGLTVIPPYQPLVIVNAPIGPGYFPSTGHKPRSGRLEILPPPNRPQPRPAPSFHRSWSSESPNLPASSDPPLNPPDVILAPRMNSPRVRPLPRGP